MGLDMYAYAVDKESSIDAFKIKEGASKEELFYWRKNNALHSWMNRLFTEKGGSDNPSDFNCQCLQLTKEDLLALQGDILDDKLQPASGFFWGSLCYDSDMKQEDLKFVAVALSYVADGWVVYYDSWW